MRPKRPHALPAPPLLLLLLLLTPAASAQIMSGESATVELARGRLPQGVTWSSSLQPSDEGLVTKPLDAPNASWDIWLQTQALPVGLSWRPLTSTSMRLFVNASGLGDPFMGAFFRYSSDRVHWSSWYNMKRAEGDAAKEPYAYEGEISLPRGAREKYTELMREWWRTNPVWSSDEHEFCVWLAHHHPDYLATEFPLIGYLQFRIEGSGRDEFNSLKVEQRWMVGGLHSIPKGKVRPTTEEKWFFDLNTFRRAGL